MDIRQASIGVIYDSAQAYNEVADALAGYFSYRKASLKDYASDGALAAALNIFCVNVSGEATLQRLKGAIKRGPGEVLIVLPSYNSSHISELRQYTKAEYFVTPLDKGAFRGAVKAALNRPVEKAWAQLAPAQRTALQSAVVSFEKCFDQAAQRYRSRNSA